MQTKCYGCGQLNPDILRSTDVFKNDECCNCGSENIRVIPDNHIEWVKVTNK